MRGTITELRSRAENREQVRKRRASATQRLTISDEAFEGVVRRPFVVVLGMLPVGILRGQQGWCVVVLAE